MFYTPADINTVDVPIVLKHDLGGMKRAFATYEAVEELATIFLTADATGALTLDPINAPAGVDFPSGASDLAISVSGQLIATAAPVVTLDVLFNDATTGTAVGTFAKPKWVKNTGFNFQQGVAVDLVPSSAGKTVKRITGLASITNAKANSELKIYKLPGATNWQPVDTVEDFNPRQGIREAISVPDGLVGTSEVVAGRSQENELEIRTLSRGVLDGFTRYGGYNVSVRAEVWKSGRVLSERYVFGNCQLAADQTMPDGNDFNRQNVRGKYQYGLFFYAK